ncbi:MAG TPA: adenylate/guanylate cyclase domain-containing protein [Baekduia sp.]|nr:adenylate/guanylate cyclase domain-containing protein [Baekduia sp.]
MRARLHALRRILRGDPGDASGPAVLRVTRVTVAVAAAISTIVGVGVVVVLLVLVLPLPEEVEDDRVHFLVRNLAVAAGYVAFALPLGMVLGLRGTTRTAAWLREERPPTEAERADTLRLPLRLVRLQGSLWLGAAALFFVVNVGESSTLAAEIAFTVTLGGVATTAVLYLVEQRLDRALIARALEGAPPRRWAVPGVAGRALVTWALTTSVPVAGIVVLSISALLIDVEADRLAVAALFLASVSLVVGLLAMTVFARSIADPLRALRDALGAVESGDLDVAVPVNDASEVGYVSAGFNRMVAGLRESERLHDLFGRHVGRDVARQALEEGVTLGGEEREAAVLFVDMVGSTALAEQRSPGEVVEILNRFFAVVVDVTGRHGGLIDGFEGDGALAVFGAPLGHPDPAGAALAAGREMAARLRDDVPGVRAGIGISAGTVVAGNVGTADRFEYTVIGDPVNEAARLTELAKDHAGGVLASTAALELARGDEPSRWRCDGDVTLRGRRGATGVAAPSGA